MKHINYQLLKHLLHCVIHVLQ